MDFVHDQHRVHRVAFALVWCVKRGKWVLVDQVARDCERIIYAVCEEHGWLVVRLAVAPDHVDMVVRASPSVTAHEIVRACKGRTSRVLRGRYPVLRRLPSLWSRAYLCSTVGSVAQSTVDGYVAEQVGR